MNSKKRMMFILEEDYYFITIKILSILIALECNIKPFEDYRRLAIIFEFIKDDSNISFMKKLYDRRSLDLFENERSVKIFCESKLDVSVIKRVLFFLEKQNMVTLQKNPKKGSIDVILLHNDLLKELVDEEIIKKDIENCVLIKNTIYRLRTLKLTTLQDKIFGYSEVTKWEN